MRAVVVPLAVVVDTKPGPTFRFGFFFQRPQSVDVLIWRDCFVSLLGAVGIVLPYFLVLLCRATGTTRISRILLIRPLTWRSTRHSDKICEQISCNCSFSATSILNFSGSL